MPQDFIISTWPLGPPHGLLCLLAEEVEADLPAKFWLVSLAGDKHGTIVPVPVWHQSGRACTHAPQQGLQITVCRAAAAFTLQTTEWPGLEAPGWCCCAASGRCGVFCGVRAVPLQHPDVPLLGVPTPYPHAGAALRPCPHAGVSAAVCHPSRVCGFLQGSQGAATPPVTASCHRPCWGEAPRPLVQAAPAHHRAPSVKRVVDGSQMGQELAQAVGSAPSRCFSIPCSAEPSRLPHIPTEITAGRYRLPCPNPAPSAARTRASPCCNPAPKMPLLWGEGWPLRGEPLQSRPLWQPHPSLLPCVPQHVSARGCQWRGRLRCWMPAKLVSPKTPWLWQHGHGGCPCTFLEGPGAE